MKFKTQEMSIYQDMIVSAVKNGLTFVAYDFEDYYVIEYTGGY